MKEYDKPIATVDLIIVTLIDNIPHFMLTKRTEDPFKDSYSLLGGFIFTDQDETINDTVDRVLKTKIGLTNIYYEQLESIGLKNRDPRGWSLSVSYVSLLPWDIAKEIKPTNKISEIQWKTLEEIENIKLAFDHNEIIKTGMQRIKTKINYSTLPVYLLPEYFTLTELQNVYEAFLGIILDKSGFRKKIKDIPFLEETDLKTKNKNCRPAKLYKAKKGLDLEYFRSNIN